MWYIVILQSKPNYSTLWLANYDLSPLAKAEFSYFFPSGKENIWTKKIRIGNALVGSIRNIQMFRKFLTLSELEIAPFTYLHPYRDLFLMVTLQSLNSEDTKDLACEKAAS